MADVESAQPDDDDALPRSAQRAIRHLGPSFLVLPETSHARNE
jgi:hypothetical protein